MVPLPRQIKIQRPLIFILVSRKDHTRPIPVSQLFILLLSRGSHWSFMEIYCKLLNIKNMVNIKRGTEIII